MQYHYNGQQYICRGNPKFILWRDTGCPFTIPFQQTRGIVNGIDYDIWNSYTDDRLYVNYDITNVLEKKKENKRRLQEELGLVQDDHKFVLD